MKNVSEEKSITEGQPLNEIKSGSTRKYVLIAMLGLVLALTAFGLYFYISSSYQHMNQLQQAQTASSSDLMRKMKQMLDEEKARQVVTPPEQNLSSNEVNATDKNESSDDAWVLKQPESNETNQSAVQEVPSQSAEQQPSNQIAYELSEIHDYQKSLKEGGGKALRPNEVVRKKYPAGTTPKLVIIIDDVSFPWQTRLIKEIPYKVNPSFFPPTKGHPETVRLSHEFPFAMIHLPMESKNYSSPEEDTLNTTDSIDVIEKRIKRIKEWFPHIKYYNNHTGGSYTADYNAMDRLIKTMKAYDLEFVDSRTAGNSKAPEVTRKYDMFLFSRDVFLDNSLDKAQIRHQLQESVTKAKKFGYAIAIGHPHKNTLEVLKDSKDMLEGLDLVYLNEL